MRMRTRYNIIVKTLQSKILTFTVDEYNLEEGYIKFFDSKTNRIKRFHSSNTEINEVSS